jgi:hypothetical protein
MSEYFRKYIKKDNFPIHRYLPSYPAPPLNSVPTLQTASNKLSSNATLNKQSKMTGTSTGVRRSTFQKHWIRCGYSPIRKSITLETFMKSVEKIYSPRTLKNTRKH